MTRGSTSYSKARRESFAEIPETCPAVEAALQQVYNCLDDRDVAEAAIVEAEQVIKAITTTFRDALTVAIEQRTDQEARADTLREQLEERDHEVIALHAQLNELGEQAHPMAEVRA